MTDRPSADSTYPPPPKDDEVAHYYRGLPSRPRLVGRTASIPWEPHRGTFRYSQHKRLKVVASHKLNVVWEYEVAPRILECLDDLGVLWTSTDVVRIEIDDMPHDPVVLWIGVKPGSLAGKDAVVAAYKCLDVLKEFDITDVDVELRESLVTRSAGAPALLPPEGWLHESIIPMRHAFTHALSIPISSTATPHIVGTGGLFISTGSSPSSDLFLLTARHAVLPPDATTLDEDAPDATTLDEDAPVVVLAPGDAALETCLAAAKDAVRDHEETAESNERRLATLDAQPNGHAARLARKVEEARGAVKRLHAFYAAVEPRWAAPAARVLGHVAHAPPVHSTREGYADDYALIRVADGKIDRAEFTGNVIDLGKLKAGDFCRKMFPGYPAGAVSRYPHGRLLVLEGVLSDDELRRPTQVDGHGAPCMMVLKDGAGSGVTIGRASGIMSFVREYADDGTHRTSKAWPILPYDENSPGFAEPGDSGAAVVDGFGRIGGMIFGGAGTPAEYLDITYAIPFAVVERSIKAVYPEARLYGQIA